jgi:hypothetical protein
LLIIKTIRKNFTAVRDAIKELHTYELPECVSVPIEDGSEAYLKWIANQCRADTPVRLAGSLKKANICGAAGTRAGSARATRVLDLSRPIDRPDLRFLRKYAPCRR